MKMKEEFASIKKEYKDVKTKRAEVTDKELEQVTGGAVNKIITFNGKFLNDGSHNIKITTTETVLYSESKPGEGDN